MDKNILIYLDTLVLNYESLKSKLDDLTLINDRELFIKISKELSSIKDLVLLYINYKSVLVNLLELNNLLKEDDELKDLVLKELDVLVEKKNILELSIKNILNKNDKSDSKSIFFEIRAATGGLESSIFVSDLLRMYLLYFDKKNWKYEDVGISYTECGGYKEVVKRVIGDNVYSTLKYESGVHRVQRIPKTEAHGRVHTSTCTVAVLPETDIIDDIEINVNDLRIDTFRASGAGGQHVNKTDSAVRITHIPTGLITECQAERSQHKNKAKAISYLKSKLLINKQNEQKKEINFERKSLVGKGERSDKIRTYNYSQNRVTDHRLNVSLCNLVDVMNGNLDQLLNKLIMSDKIF